MKRLLLIPLAVLLVAGVTRERQRDRTNTGNFGGNPGGASDDDDGGGTTYTEEILADNPVLYYPLDGEDESTEANQDFSGNDNDGVFSGSPSTGEDGAGINTGLSVSFDGTDDILKPSTHYSPTITDWTVEMWFLTPNGNTDGLSTFISWQENGGSGGGIHLGIGTGPGPVAGDGLVWCGWAEPFIVEITRSTSETHNDGNWHHLVCSYNGTDGVAFDAENLIIYVDGEAIAVTQETAAGDYTDTAPHTTNRAWFAGTNAGSWNAFTTVKLDEIAIYETALSAERVLVHYEIGAGI